MFRMAQKLEIIGKGGSPHFVFSHIVHAKLEQDREVPIDTIKVVLPRYKGFDFARIERGMQLKWYAGYAEFLPRSLDIEDPRAEWPDQFLEFSGTITEVGHPSGKKDTNKADRVLQKSSDMGQGRFLEIVARDGMYPLAFVTLPRSYGSYSGGKAVAGEPTTGVLDDMQAKLSDAGVDTSFEIRYDPSDVNPSGKYYCPCAGKSVVYALWAMRKVWKGGFGIDVYYRRGKIVLRDPGDRRFLETESIPVFKTASNIKQDDLMPRPGRNIEIQVQGYDLSKGVRVTGKYSNPAAEGSPESMFFDVEGVSSSSEANEKAQQIYEQLAGDGFTGSLKTFGYPQALTSNLIFVADPQDRQRNKLCIVDKVTKEFNSQQSFFEQQIWPGPAPAKIVNATTALTSPSSSPSSGEPRSPGEGWRERAAAFLAADALQPGFINLAKATELANDARSGS